MKVCIKNNNSITLEQSKVVKDFVSMIQSELPLTNNVNINFVPERDVKMTTGVRFPKGKIFVLSGNRLLIDILRTLAHEWVHAYQINVLKREQGPNIGGQNEDEANAYGGRLIKMFEEEYPQFNEYVFEGLKGINNKINLINEQILISEKQNIKKDFIMEMKKIGIEKLPYSYSSMKQFVDPETMDIHYNKHY